MASEIKRMDPNAPGILADRDMYLAGDEYTVVEKGDAKARYLLAARGSYIDAATIARLSLSAKGGKVAQGEADEGEGDEEGVSAALLGARVNEGQLRDPGEPLILAPRTGVMRGEMVERVIPKAGEEVEAAPKTIAVSNVPAEDDAFRAKVAKESVADAPAAEKPKAAKKKSARKGK